MKATVRRSDFFYRTSSIDFRIEIFDLRFYFESWANIGKKFRNLRLDKMGAYSRKFSKFVKTKTMTSQAVKLSLIDWLIHLNDDKLISEVQSIRKKDFVKSYEASLKPFTEEELLSRIAQSEDDFKNGRTTSLEHFRREIDKW